MQTQRPTQPQLPLDHTPALEAEMRVFFDTRWGRWHKARTFDAAMQDPVTRKCLVLAVQHLPHNRRAPK